MPQADSVVGIDLGLGPLRGAVRRHEDRQPPLSAQGREEVEEGAAGSQPEGEGSANRAKARLRVARAHARTVDARREFHHQISAKAIRENQAAVESLAVKGLARTRLAKSVHDAGWSAFTAMLEYKAARYGRTFVRIGRFEPTSQVCSACGVKDGPKPLNVREWTCAACGAVLDRDINAAVNIAKAAGLAASACRARARPGPLPAQRKETGTHPRPHPGESRRESPTSRLGGSQWTTDWFRLTGTATPSATRSLPP
ncbi:RNA-guided endonuclease TnpB family protein [Streptomyces vinaceus]